MDKLIITCATDWFAYQGVAGLHCPETVRENADSVRSVRDAGAAIVHMHEPLTSDTRGKQGSHIDAWIEIAQLVRQETDIIFEHGQGGNPYTRWEERVPGSAPNEPQEALRIERPEMISAVLNSIDFAWREKPSYSMTTREGLEQYMHLCRQCSVKPAFEVWHSGSFFNLQWLVDRGVVNQPYWLTLFFGCKGGMSGPATIEELLYRVHSLPKDALWEVAVFSGVKGATTAQQLTLVTQAILLGGHVRVGMEDNPYYWDGVPAESNAQLVERVVRIAKELGREIATPDEARHIIGLTTNTDDYHLRGGDDKDEIC